MVKINVNEIYGPVIQGEGMWAGKRCSFIRLNGCNLRCEWQNKDGTLTKCDTPYTSWDAEPANMMEVEDIVKKLKEFEKEFPITDVIITGGEPMLQHGVVDLCKALYRLYDITIETNGTIYKSTYCDLLSISPKLKSSIPISNDYAKEQHIKNRVYEKTIPQYLEDYNLGFVEKIQFKFVYNEPTDIIEIEEFRSQFKIPESMIWLMPQGADLDQQLERTEETMNAAIKHGYNFTSRLHVLAYGNKRGV